MARDNVKKVLAVASTGGHWLQLQRLRPALEGCEVVYVSTVDYSSQLSERQFVVRDANQWDKFGLVIMAIQIFWILLKVRPDVVISTGAAPGFFSLMISKLFGKKTVWLDSVANSRELSLCGVKVRRFADLYLTQWPEVADKTNATYRGAVL